MQIHPRWSVADSWQFVLKKVYGSVMVPSSCTLTASVCALTRASFHSDTEGSSSEACAKEGQKLGLLEYLPCRWPPMHTGGRLGCLAR